MREAPPPYGIIYNWDGAPFDYSEYPQSIEQLLEKTYAPIKDTQVGALCYSMGTHEANWPTDTVEMAGDSVGREYDLVRSMRHIEGLRAMFERGENPYEAMVKRGRELGVHVYSSIRMNDQHFWTTHTLDDMLKSKRAPFTQMRLDHPEWCLGEDHAPGWCATSWNMAIPEVRELKLQMITEACRLADWDGVELDWQRHAFHLPDNHEYRLRYTLTDLQRAVRKMTDQIAEERGRPFYVAARVGATMEACRRVGYDIETWAKEGLIDVLITGGNSGTDPGVDVEAFTGLFRDRGIQLYTGFDNDGRQAARRLIPHREWRQAWFRACAQELYDRGANGMYVFNWHATERTQRPLMTTLGAPETLRGANKAYAAVHRTITPKGSLREDAERDDRLYGETPVTLYRTLTSGGPRFHVPVHDGVLEEAKKGRLESVELLIELEHFSATEDEVEVTFDDKKLGAPVVRNAAAEDPNDPSDVDENSWLVWTLDPAQADRGRHEIQVRLLKRDPRIRAALVVQHVEIWVNYKQ